MGFANTFLLRSELLSSPWPYIDSLADQESEEVIDAKIPAIIGSCGHNNCDDCKNWIAYPQSHFGNWTIKPVRKCGIERAVKNRDHSSTIYTVDVLENGVFGDSGETQVTSENKREYWRETLLPEVSVVADPIPSDLVSFGYQRKRGIRVRALFIEDMSGPVLQMLGARYVLRIKVCRSYVSHADLTDIPSSRSFSVLASIGYLVDTRWAHSTLVLVIAS